MKTGLLTLFTLSWLAAAAHADPPANDQFANAGTLVLTASGTNLEATSETDEPAHADTPAAKSVWWSFTPATGGLWEISTAGSNFDTRLAVYTGNSVNALAPVAENDDLSLTDYLSRVVFTATGGTVYRIAVDGYNGEAGAIQLTARPFVPSNNDFAGAADLGSVTSAAESVQNHGATAEAGEPAHAGQAAVRSLWWKWTPSFAGNVVVDTAGSEVDTLLAVYTGTAINGLTRVVENDNAPGTGNHSRVAFPALAGTTYWIAVDSVSGAEGRLALQLVQTPVDIALANDHFVNAAVLTTQATGNNTASTAEPNEPAHAGSPASHSSWWIFTPAVSGPVEIQTTGSNFDTLLAVYTGSSVNALTLVAENDDYSGIVRQSRVIFNAAAGTVYRIVVDGYRAATGTILLSAHGETNGNDHFANATDLGSVATAASTANNRGATAEPGEPAHAGQAADESLWWSWTPPATARVTINTQGSTMDTLLAVYTGSALNALTLIADNDDAPGLGLQSSVTFTAEAGITYRIAVDAYHGNEGEVALNITAADPVARPGNDHFADAAFLPAGIESSATGTSTHATFESGEPAHTGQSTVSTVWWTWRAPTSGTVALNTIGSKFDTVLAVYTGTAVNTLTLVASNDDEGATRQSALEFMATGGTDYHIAVGGLGEAAGDITLMLKQTPDVPGNDAFASATDLGNAASAASAGVNLGAGAEELEPAHDGEEARRTVWWKWTCPEDHVITISTSGSSIDTLLAVYTGTALDDLSPVASNDDEVPGSEELMGTSAVEFFATGGTTYFIAVDGKGGAAGLLFLELSRAFPPNDNFASAALLAGVSDAGSSFLHHATAQPGEPAHAGSPAVRSVWWDWTAPANGLVELSSAGSSMDTRLAVYTGESVDALSPVRANDNEPEGLNPWSLVRFRAVAGTDYRIAMDAAAPGLAQLSLTTSVLVNDNDAFADRIDLGNAAAVDTTGTNLGASPEIGEPEHRGQPSVASVWWQWTAPASGWIRVSSSASDFTSRLAVYTGNSLPTLAEVVNVSRTGSDPASINFLATAGTAYLIAVDGVANRQGGVALQIGPGSAPAAPVNDHFLDATVLTGATPLTFEGRTSPYGTAEPGEPAHGGDAAANSVWFQWTAPFTGRAVLDGTAMSIRPRLAVYTGSAVGSLTPVVQNTSAGKPVLAFDAVMGTVYHIALDTQTIGVIEITIDYPPPSNDLFAEPAVLAGVLPVSGSGSTTGATAEPEEPAHAGESASNSVWWKWTAPSTGPVTIDTVGSAVDTLLGVYTGNSVNALTLVAANDDSGTGATSRVDFMAISGTVYHIAVDAYQGSTGVIALSIRADAVPAAPVNDNFADATLLHHETPLNAVGSNVHATPESGEPAHAGSPANSSVWWKWTAPANTVIRLDTSGSEMDTVLAVYTGSTVAAPTLIASNDDADGGVVQSALTFAATGGTTYRFAVDGYNGATGSISLNLQAGAPANDHFANRISLGNASSVLIQAANFAATAEAGEPAHGGVPAARSVWWTWSPRVNMAVELYSDNPANVIAVHTGSLLNALTSVPVRAGTRGIVFDAVAGRNYQIAVDSGAEAATGQFQLSLSPSGLSPLEQWRAANFQGNPANSGNGASNADPDGDGYSNLLEFVFGSAPDNAASGFIEFSTSTPGFLIITFPRVDASEGLVDLAMETTSSLSSWDTFGIGAGSANFPSGVRVTVQENGPAPDTVSVAIPVPSDGRVFSRILATE